MQFVPKHEELEEQDTITEIKPRGKHKEKRKVFMDRKQSCRTVANSQISNCKNGVY